MSVSERVLLALSRSPTNRDYPLRDDEVTVENALDELVAHFGPDVFEWIRGKAILDYGCGHGKHAVAALLGGAAHVTCVDIGEGNIASAKALALKHGVPGQLNALVGDVHEVRLPANFYDTVLSINAFEHFAAPHRILELCHPALKTGGCFLITFGPPWFHPLGSHMHFFTRLPWPHLLFSEDVVMKVRSRFRQDGAARYCEVEGGLNQMGVQRFTKLVRASGYSVERIELRAVKGMTVLTRLPLLREGFTNRVNCVLRKP